MRLQVNAPLNYAELLTSSDMVCSTAFDRDDEFFATAGVSRRIKIFSYNSVLEQNSGIHYPVLEIPSRQAAAVALQAACSAADVVDYWPPAALQACW